MKDCHFVIDEHLISIHWQNQSYIIDETMTWCIKPHPVHIGNLLAYFFLNYVHWIIAALVESIPALHALQPKPSYWIGLSGNVGETRLTPQLADTIYCKTLHFKFFKFGKSDHNLRSYRSDAPLNVPILTLTLTLLDHPLANLPEK